MRRWIISKTALAVPAALAVAVGFAIAGHLSSDVAASQTVVVSGAVPEFGPTRAEIIDRVTQMKAIVSRIDRIDAKATTWAEYLQSHDTGIRFTQETTPAATRVWVVAVSGVVVPPHARGETYNWGVIVFDATNGSWLFTEASYRSGWPDYFDALRGR